MESRFKFRAWNLETGIMHYDVEDTYDGISNNAIEHSNFSAVLEDDEYIVMQCTGIMDKTGKFIYESDILKVPYGKNMRKGIVEWSKFEGMWVVKFKDGIKEDFNLYNGLKENQVEIIGNIYTEGKDGI